MAGWPASHYYIICKNLPQLREISLQPDVALKTFFISDIIRNAGKLEWFQLAGWIDKTVNEIDSALFKEWVKIVTNRCTEMPLELWLCAESYTTKHEIPVKASEGAFTLIMSDKFRESGNIDYKKWKKGLHLECEFVSNF